MKCQEQKPPRYDIADTMHVLFKPRLAAARQEVSQPPAWSETGETDLEHHPQTKRYRQEQCISHVQITLSRRKIGFHNCCEVARTESSRGSTGAELLL